MNYIPCNCQQSLELQSTINIAYLLLNGKGTHRVENAIRILKKEINEETVKEILQKSELKLI